MPCFPCLSSSKNHVKLGLIKLYAGVLGSDGHSAMEPTDLFGPFSGAGSSSNSSSNTGDDVGTDTNSSGYNNNTASGGSDEDGLPDWALYVAIAVPSGLCLLCCLLVSCKTRCGQRRIWWCCFSGKGGAQGNTTNIVASTVPYLLGTSLTWIESSPRVLCMVLNILA